MKAMILAAGLGTRLRPWTLSHPKALVPVDGVPMLRRVMDNLEKQGFDDIVVNVHHFAGQIAEYVETNASDKKVALSDERLRLLDTGGGVFHARGLLAPEEGPVLIHNVDILSNADLRGLFDYHIASGADVTLLVSNRKSSRKLLFNRDMRLVGWHNLKDDSYRPDGFSPSGEDAEYAFSGIYIVGEKAFEEMTRLEKDEKFSIIDFLLKRENGCKIIGYCQPGLELLDIGKPETLVQASRLLAEIDH